MLSLTGTARSVILIGRTEGKLMDLIFLLIAVCPAAAAAGYECVRGEDGRSFGAAFAEWFYCVTFVNLALLYARGWGSFDFTAFSVVFLLKYMLSSAAAVAVVWVGKWGYRFLKRGRH